MPDRDWLNIPEPVLTSLIVTDLKIPDPRQRMKEALLSIADLAHRLEPGELMVVHRHDDGKMNDRRMFTVTVHKESKADEYLQGKGT